MVSNRTHIPVCGLMLMYRMYLTIVCTCVFAHVYVDVFDYQISFENDILVLYSKYIRSLFSVSVAVNYNVCKLFDTIYHCINKFKLN